MGIFLSKKIAKNKNNYLLFLSFAICVCHSYAQRKISPSFGLKKRNHFTQRIISLTVNLRPYIRMPVR